jgi:hypothetical protein
MHASHFFPCRLASRYLRPAIAIHFSDEATPSRRAGVLYTTRKRCLLPHTTILWHISRQGMECCTVHCDATRQCLQCHDGVRYTLYHCIYVTPRSKAISSTYRNRPRTSISDTSISWLELDARITSRITTRGRRTELNSVQRNAASRCEIQLIALIPN